MTVLELLRVIEYCGKHIEDEEVVDELRRLYVWLVNEKVVF